ncbi:MAG: carbamoyltransferase [Planctomycetes bacterium]|nr:carbamoyltransferase [Planctomycetota bacterium]
MFLLGISAFYHDSAAALIEDGRIVAAAQEERFTRKKHDPGFPRHAIDACLAEAGIGIEQLGGVVFYDKPWRKFERLLSTWIAEAPRGFGAFRRGLPVWLRDKLWTRKAILRGLDGRYRGRVSFTEHHESHAASAFYPSPFDEAAVLTMDGVGEWATASIGVGRGKRLELQSELRFPHSLGLLYSAFTYFCGFRVNSGEYKLMGLAPYGEPRFAQTILSELLDLKEDGSFRLDMRYFAYTYGNVMTSKRFDALFGGPRREPESEITQREMDLAASIQAVTEEIVLRIARHAHERTKLSKLCLAGGVALNCVANGRLLREGPFDDVWIQPAAGDAGGALGAALFVWHHVLGNERESSRKTDAQSGSLLGPEPDAEDIATFLNGVGAVATRYDSQDRRADVIAGLLAEGKVVGRMSGRMEFGPRALGNRSILGDPRSPSMQRTMNLKIKFRESFRPFAPSVLTERAHDWFATEADRESPYMLQVAQVHASKRIESSGDAVGLTKLAEPRSVIPAVTHVDGSARIQTVDASRNPDYRLLLEKFEQRTGCPAIINTSFNVRGEPIVCTPNDAWRCFLVTDMDALVLGPFVLLKCDQVVAPERERDEHLSRFAPD